MAEGQDQIMKRHQREIRRREQDIATTTRLKLRDEEVLVELEAELTKTSNEEESKKLTVNISRKKQLIESKGLRIKLLEKQIKERKESEYMEAYRIFISNKEYLEMPFLKFIFAGTPRVGKTTALRRLMGKIINLLVAGEASKAHPSTGAVEYMGDIIVKKMSSCTALIAEANWSVVENDADEAGMLFQRLLQSVRSASTTPSAATAPTQSKPSLGGSSEPIPTSPSSSLPTDIIVDIFKKASTLPNFFEDANNLFRAAYLRIEDTGGQPELMDMLPALTIGPGLYMLFFNLEWSLKKEFPVFYQHHSGKATTAEESKITLEEMLLSTLSSISCSQQIIAMGENPNSSDIHEILESSRSVAYLVGTHRDKVSEEKISQLDDDLQSIIRGTDFFDKKLVKFCSDGKLIVTMDNMEGGVEEVEAIKKMLDNAIEREFKKLKIPVAWLFLNLCLHMTEGRITSVENVFKLSSQFNMSKEETEVALWFLHHHAGVLTYFPNVPQLNDLVILNNQVVYDSVTELILKAMTFDNVGQACAERFRETGQFLLKDLLDATAKVSGGDLIPPEKLIAFLEFLHIIARIERSQSSTEEQEMVYLMPCILRTSNKDMLDAVCNDQSRPQHIAPLMIRYKCGFVPLGIFPALIASLISNGSFRLVKEDIMKNKVQFHYGDLRTLVSLLCYPKFYAIIISRLPVVKCNIQEECVAIRKNIETSLENVSLHMNYANFMDYQFAFQCPKHSGAVHLCVMDRGSVCSKVMDCIQNPKRPEPVEVEPHHMVWFGEIPIGKSSAANSESTTTITDIPFKMSNLRVLKWKNENGDTKRLKILEEICPHWKEIGDLLGLHTSRIKAIEKNRQEVEDCCRDVITDWLESDVLDYPATWKDFIVLLEDIDLNSLVERIKIAIQHKN